MGNNLKNYIINYLERKGFSHINIGEKKIIINHTVVRKKTDILELEQHETKIFFFLEKTQLTTVLSLT